MISALQKARSNYQPKLPPALRNGANAVMTEGAPTQSIADQDKIAELFACTYASPEITFSSGDGSTLTNTLNCGVILSGGQAPGGHNVIAGLFDGLKSLNPENKLYGFLGGPSGLIENSYIDLTAELIDQYRNTGGFDIIGSGFNNIRNHQATEKSRG